MQAQIRGELLPNPGDAAEVFFVIPGVEERASVGSGRVLGAETAMVTIRIERGAARPQAGNRVCITSAHPRKPGEPPRLPEQEALADGKPAASTGVVAGTGKMSWLGLGFEAVPVEMIRAMSLRPASGAQVCGVMPGSPADAAGLRIDDIISEMDGEVVRVADLVRVTVEKPPGTVVSFCVLRNGKAREIKVTLGALMLPEAFAALAKREAEAGDAWSQMILGSLLLAGEGVARDEAAAEQWFKKSAEQGFAVAQALMGIRVMERASAPELLAEARGWFAKAAAGGNADAQTALAAMHHGGHGGPRDVAEAVRYYRLAAEQGHVEASRVLGAMLLYGRDIAADPVEAVNLLMLAANEDRSDAQFNLGLACQQGAGIERDNAKALKWFRSAAALGEAEAAFEIGAMYERGIGVAADRGEAERWYRRAADAGSERAKQHLERSGK